MTAGLEILDLPPSARGSFPASWTAPASSVMPQPSKVRFSERDLKHLGSRQVEQNHIGGFPP
jgi:hypothetical protein